jgi:transposase
MIVIGVDVHKHSLSAVAVDGVGRQLDALETSDLFELLSWSRRVGRRRLWALEDCRHVTRALERTLQRQRQRLVRVPPRLTGPERRRGRVRGKSDLIDALAIARAALREPRLDSPRPEEERLRELKLLVDHRDDLVDERRRCQQRLRWHLHELDLTLQVPLGALDRAIWLERLGRRLARHKQSTQVRIARELLGRCRGLSRSILELDHQLQAQIAAAAPRLLELPGCGGLTAAKLLSEIGPINRFPSDAQLARHAGVAPPRRQLRQTPTPPPRPRRQPPTQLRPPPHRRHPRPHPPTSPRLPRTQTSRRQDPPRSPPLPQTPTRPHHLHHPQKRAPIDIGATLAQASVPLLLNVVRLAETSS